MFLFNLNFSTFKSVGNPHKNQLFIRKSTLIIEFLHDLKLLDDVGLLFY